MLFLKPNVKKLKARHDSRRLVEALRHKEANVRREAKQALVEMGGEATGPLVAVLKDRDPEIRDLAAAALGELGDARAIEPLATVLKDENGVVRFNVALALGRLGDSRAGDHLFYWLLDRLGSGYAGSHQTLWIALETLIKISQKQAVAVLARALEKGDHDAQQRAAIILSDILERTDDPSARSALEKFSTNASAQKAQKEIPLHEIDSRSASIILLNYPESTIIVCGNTSGDSWFLRYKKQDRQSNWHLLGNSRNEAREALRSMSEYLPRWRMRRFE